ncbi:MAG: [FeFe] hydrogenase H-cluster radical SAM maturase HydE [Myxococcales bacterium]|nr:[FeFe] hydrogenase H-cluster radical SAM maturase HydE [Myxococcales bacterium]
MTTERERIAARLADEGQTAALCAEADAIRRREFGAVVHLRAIVEFSNHCRGSCLYCGINRDHRELSRYRLAWPEVLAAARRAAARGLRTIVLQSGEDPELDRAGLARTVSAIKAELGAAVTLSCGEWPRETYRRWREAGADRYLLKLETADEELYRRMHPGMSQANRRRCLDDLFDLGYEVGSGCLVGLPGQTAASLALDILDFAARPYDMVAVGPLIPANGTALAELPKPPADLALRMVALTRLYAPRAHIPATTALCALDPEARRRALTAGANVVMINFTPPEAAPRYGIYQRAACGSTDNCLDCMTRTFAELGLTVADDAGSGVRSRAGATDAAHGT